MSETEGSDSEADLHNIEDDVLPKTDVVSNETQTTISHKKLYIQFPCKLPENAEHELMKVDEKRIKKVLFSCCKHLSIQTFHLTLPN